MAQDFLQGGAHQVRKAPAWGRRRMCAWGTDSATSPGQLRAGRLQLDDDEVWTACVQALLFPCRCLGLNAFFEWEQSSQAS